MSTSTDAILLYGIPLEEDAFEAYDEDDESAPEEGPAWLAYMGGDEDGVILEQHQSSEFPKYFAAIKASIITAWRGHPKDITGKNLAEYAEWEARLAAFVAKYSLPTEGKCGWWLASDWS